LGNTSDAGDSSELSGFNSAVVKVSSATNAPTVLASTGWAAVCVDLIEREQVGVTVLIVILVVIAAVAILFVIRLL